MLLPYTQSQVIYLENETNTLAMNFLSFIFILKLSVQIKSFITKQTFLFLFFPLGACVAQSCDFETNTCGWQQATNDKFDWTRQSGKTGTSGTGATTDHTSLVKKLNGMNLSLY